MKNSYDNHSLASRIKEHFAPIKQTGSPAPAKNIDKENKEYLLILEMWHNYLNFSRLEF